MATSVGAAAAGVSSVAAISRASLDVSQVCELQPKMTGDRRVLGFLANGDGTASIQSVAKTLAQGAMSYYPGTATVRIPGDHIKQEQWWVGRIGAEQSRPLHCSSAYCVLSTHQSPLSPPLFSPRCPQSSVDERCRPLATCPPHTTGGKMAHSWERCSIMLTTPMTPRTTRS